MAEPDHPHVIAPPVAIVAGFVLLGAGAEYLWPADLWPSGLWAGGFAWRAVGGAAIVAGVALALWAVLAFRAHGTSPEPWKPTTAVVASGPYRFSRNPIYLAFGLIHLGIGAAAASPWILATALPGMIVLRTGVIAPEERYLEAKFGETYLRYKRAVRRWV